MNIFGLFRKPVVPVKPEQKPSEFQNTGLEIRASEWRKNTAYVSEAQSVLNNPTFKRMLEVMRNESPGNFAVLNNDLATRAIHQSRTEGYCYCLTTLLSLGNLITEQPHFEETFEPETEPTL